MISAARYQEINRKAKEDKMEKEIQSKVDNELMIIEKIIDESISKDKSLDHVILKMDLQDLHARTIKRLNECGFIVYFNKETREYIVSWNTKELNDILDEANRVGKQKLEIGELTNVLYDLEKYRAKGLKALGTPPSIVYETNKDISNELMDWLSKSIKYKVHVGK